MLNIKLQSLKKKLLKITMFNIPEALKMFHFDKFAFGNISGDLSWFLLYKSIFLWFDWTYQISFWLPMKKKNKSDVNALEKSLHVSLLVLFLWFKSYQNIILKLIKNSDLSSVIIETNPFFKLKVLDLHLSTEKVDMI